MPDERVELINKNIRSNNKRPTARLSNDLTAFAVEFDQVVTMITSIEYAFAQR